MAFNCRRRLHGLGFSPASYGRFHSVQPVIREASYPNRLAQQNFLLGRGIECNSMAQNHWHGRASMALAARFRAVRFP